MSSSATVLQINYSLSNETTYASLFLILALVQNYEQSLEKFEIYVVVFYISISILIIGFNFYLSKNGGKNQKRILKSIRAV